MSAAPPPSDTLTIKTGGKILGGWLSARIERGIERLPSSYVIEITEFYPGQSGVAVVQPGAPAQVYAGGDLLLTGWIDVYSPRYEAEQHQVRIEGRSLCEDLVDCSIVPPVPGLGPTGWQFSGGSIGQWAEMICAPFKIPVSLPQGDFKLDANQVFTINPGETAYQLLQTMSRNAMVLLYDDPQGRLVISQAGTMRAGSPLVEGVNAEVAEARLSMDQRYQTIEVLAVVPAQAAPNGMYHLNVDATVTDTGVPRYRPLLVVMDVPEPAGNGAAWANLRATWELNRRVARSQVVNVEVTGWRDGAGTLWTPNTLVRCTLPTAKINNVDMLIANVVWSKGPRGTSSLLSLMPPQGFQPEPFHAPPPVAGISGPGSSPTP